MAITFTNASFNGTQQSLGLLAGTTYTGTDLPGTNVTITLNGTAANVGSTVSAFLNNPATGSITVAATYEGYTGTPENPVYYFSAPDLTALGFTGFAVTSTSTVPAANLATTITAADAPVCFARGTLILTDRGEVAVEALQSGDLVATAAQGASPEAPAFRPVRFVGTRRYDLTVAGSEIARPIRVHAGALGGGLPHRDLVVSGDHCLFLDGQLVPAKFLVNGSSVTTETAMAEVTYFHIELDSHDLVFSEGALTESWLDNGNRSRFSNATVVALRPVDDLPRAWNEGACHPHLIEGAELDTLHARLAAISAEVAAPAKGSIAA